MTQFFKILTLAAALLVAAAPATAMTFFLTEQWVGGNGDRMCRYGNGTVLNVGYRICPLSIEG
jgi:hypothetical protein